MRDLAAERAVLPDFMFFFINKMCIDGEKTIPLWLGNVWLGGNSEKVFRGAVRLMV